MKVKKQLLMITLLLCMLCNVVPLVSAVTSLSINMGSPQKNGDKFYYSQAELTGGGITSLVVSFSESITLGDEIFLPTSPTGFTVSSSSVSNKYAKRISLNGVTTTQVQDYIRDIGFTIGGEKQTIQVIISTENVDHDTYYNVDTEHYYQFIPSTTTTWTQAYEAVKSMTYMGRTGYLATIMSMEEDIFLNTLSGGKSGWLGGTTMIPIGEKVDASNGKTGPLLYYKEFNLSANNNYWTWQNGPEIGMKFYNTSAYSESSDLDTEYYFNWAKNRFGDSEPNNQQDGDVHENCLTTLDVTSQGFTGKQGTEFSWNDLTYKNTGTNIWSPKGYFVEYGNKFIGDTTTEYVASVTATVELSNAKGIYVSSTGNDTNAGTIDDPFKTLNKAFESVTQDTTIYILDDITLDDGIIYTGSHSITITSCDEGGKALTNKAGNYDQVNTITRGLNYDTTMFMFSNAGQLSNSSGATGTVTFNNIIVDGGNRVLVHESGNNARESQGYIIYTNSNDFTVNLGVNSILQNNNNTGSDGLACGGGVCLNRIKEFNMTDNAIIRGNIAPRHGGAITTYGGIINMSQNASIYGNGISYSNSFSGYYGGGAVLLYADYGKCELNLRDNALITNNYVNLNGGSDGGRPHCAVMAPNDRILREDINIKGNARIYGNRDISENGSFNEETWTLSGGTENNLYAKPGFLNVVEPLGSNAKIGITLINATSGSVAAKGTSNYTITHSDVAQLFYDAGEYAIIKSDNEAILSNAIEDLTLGKLSYDEDRRILSGKLNIDVSLNNSEAKLLINGIAQDPSSYTVTVLDKELLVTIGDHVTLIDGDKVSLEITKNGYTAAQNEIIVSDTKLILSDVEINGVTGSPIEETDMTLNLSNAKFNAANLPIGTDVTALLHNLPAGLTAQIKSITDGTMVITISGTPTSSALSPIELSIPQDITVDGETISFLLDEDGNEYTGVTPVLGTTNSNAMLDIERAPSTTGIFSGKYGQGQAFNVTITPEVPVVGEAINISEFDNITGWDDEIVDWGVNGDRYIQFVDVGTKHSEAKPDSHPLILNLYEADGTYVKTLYHGGTIWGVDEDHTGFFFKGEDGKNIYISNDRPFNYGKERTYTPTTGLVSDLSDLEAYPANPAPLGLLADPELLSILSPTNVTDNGNKSFYKSVPSETRNIKIDLTVTNGAEWEIYKDEALTQLITTSTISLEVGYNHFYVKVKSNYDNADFNVYTLTVYKNAPTGNNRNPSRDSSGSVVSNNTEAHEAYINGYQDATFRAESFITRAETAVILARLSQGYQENLYYSVSFNDLEVGGWYLNQVGFGSRTGLLMGYQDGSYKPNGHITRAEFSVIVARFLNISSSSGTVLFSDLSGHWAENFISALYAQDIISGYQDGTFRPDASITRAEAVKILNTAIKRTPTKAKVDAAIGEYGIPFSDVLPTHWAYYDILEAAITHNISDFH